VSRFSLLFISSVTNPSPGSWPTFLRLPLILHDLNFFFYHVLSIPFSLVYPVLPSYLHWCKIVHVTNNLDFLPPVSSPFPRIQRINSPPGNRPYLLDFVLFSLRPFLLLLPLAFSLTVFGLIFHRFAIQNLSPSVPIHVFYPVPPFHYDGASAADADPSFQTSSFR